MLEAPGFCVIPIQKLRGACGILGCRLTRDTYPRNSSHCLNWHQHLVEDCLISIVQLFGEIRTCPCDIRNILDSSMPIKAQKIYSDIPGGCSEAVTTLPEVYRHCQNRMEEVVVGVEDPLQMSDTEQGDIALETQQESDSSAEDIADTQDTHTTGGHRRANAKASQPQGRDNLYQKIRLTKGARKPLFCSVLRMSRN